MTLRVLLFLSLSAFTANASALSESSVLEQMKNNLLNGKSCSNGKNFWNLMKVRTKIHLQPRKKGNYDLIISKFGCELGSKGSVVIAPGRTESSIEFYETAIDLVQKGFSPVYAVDHVGQGFSPRLLSDQTKGHINKFSDYVNAFDSAVKAVEQDLKSKLDRKDSKRSPLFFLSNSMGGAIGIGYFQKKGKKNPFKAAVLLGPMIRVNYLGFPDGDPTKPNGITHPTKAQTIFYTEPVVISRAKYFCAKLSCETYATKGAQEKAKKFGVSFVEGSRDFSKAVDKAPEQVMTHSRSRYNLRNFLWEDSRMKAKYKKIGLGSPQLGAPTFQWVRQTAKFNLSMRAQTNIDKMSKMPLKIITGEKDVRAYTPSSDGSTDLREHAKFCKNVNRSASAGSCEFLEIGKAFHELHKESDNFRTPVLKAVVEHFLAN